jgi:type IV secretory pathway VirB10-like protein
MALPAGTQVLGRVSRIEPLSRKRRALAMANGDFTPLRKAHVDFDTLVLKDGTRLPLHTSVSEGVPNVVHLTAGGTSKKKKGRVRGAVDAAEQRAKDKVHQTVEQVTAPGKWDRLKAAIAAELPYRRQWLTAGTQFTAELMAPLKVANSEPPPAAPDALAQLGREIPPGSVVHVSLMTPLSSATEHLGSPVRAVVSEPLFSADHHLILPAGAHLDGSVTKVVPARRLHRNGQLRFAFRQVELGPGAPRQVEASLQGVDAAAGAI